MVTACLASAIISQWAGPSNFSARVRAWMATAAAPASSSAFDTSTTLSDLTSHQSRILSVTGTWLADANGLQSMTGQLGESDRGLMASHFADTTEAASEKAQWFSAEVDNLASGAAAMVKNPRFHECAVQQLVDLGVGLDLGFPTGVNGLAVMGDFLTEIASSVTKTSPDPTIQELAVATYSDVRVIAATLNGLKR